MQARTHTGDLYVFRTIIGNVLGYVKHIHGHSKWSGGELLVPATAAAKCLEAAVGKGTTRFCLQTSNKCVRRQARNVSAKGPTTQRMDGKAFRVFTAASHPQSSYVSVRNVRILKVRKQNGSIQEMPLKQRSRRKPLRSLTKGRQCSACARSWDLLQLCCSVFWTLSCRGRGWEIAICMH